MKQFAANCNDERLRMLLQSEDASDEYLTAADHVERCAACQSRLVDLAADQDQWSTVRDLLATTDAEREWAAEEQTRPWNARADEDPVDSWNESLARQLLNPPSHPEMLGRIGEFEVERLLGTGGMGVVFKGFDHELNRPVAIKLLAPHLAGSGAARKRFAREARAAAAVVHEHVVAIHSVESEADPPYLVMQFVGGESLQARVNREGPLDLREVLRIGLQTARGLAAAHAQGLVHRDVKPSNILLEESVERTLLTDFGLARASDDASLTRSGHLPGTPHYMSPEQARGESVDHRSDLFSLGSVLYTLSTGRPPFRADTSYGTLRLITDAEPHPIQDLNPEMPDWFCSIVNRLLRKSPDARYATADEVGNLLEQCLAHVQHPHAARLPKRLQKPLAQRLLVRRVLIPAAVSAIIAAGSWLAITEGLKESPDEQAATGEPEAGVVNTTGTDEATDDPAAASPTDADTAWNPPFDLDAVEFSIHQLSLESHRSFASEPVTATPPTQTETRDGPEPEL